MIDTKGENCTACGRRGPAKGDDPCPKCGRYRKGLNLTAMNPVEVEHFVEKSGRLGIPPEYIGSPWSPALFWASHGEVSDIEKAKLTNFMDKLKDIHDGFAAGELPKKSVMVIAPSNYSKVTWAYSCMQLALKHGRSVAPLLDTAEANRILTVMSQVPKFKMYGSITVEDYLTKEILFVTVAKSYLHTQAYQVILDLLSKRSRKGLATFIISSYSIEQMSSEDWNGEFKRILDFRVGENKLKVPQIITYKEGKILGG